MIIDHMIPKFLLRRQRIYTLLSMSMLYAGKTSGVIVNLIFLPIYSQVLGSEVFGIVAVILSLQALLLMLDLGMSTVVSRDVAANEFTADRILNQIYSAELGLILFYCTLMFLILILELTGFSFGINPLIPPALIILFMLLVLQNFHYNVIIARRDYTTASTLQFTGNLARAIGTAFVLIYISSTLGAFVAIQIAVVTLQLFASRHLSVEKYKRFSADWQIKKIDSLRKSSIELLRRARPVALLSAAGAAVTQLDKPIISFFMSSADVAAYFLAMTYCLVPMAVLAGPVAQFFQPLIINALSSNNEKAIIIITKKFTITLLMTTLLPSTIMYLLSDSLVEIWLRRGPLVETTVEYIRIILPGIAIGALGYLPYSLLIAIRDYKFMAILSVSMTVITLFATTIAALHKSVWLICAVYATYHIFSTFIQWARALSKKQTQGAAATSGFIFLTSFALLSIALISLVR